MDFSDFPFISSTFSRTTSFLTLRNSLDNIQRIRDELSLLQNQLSSGRRILSLSQDPTSLPQLFDTKKAISMIDSKISNLQDISSLLDMVDSSISNINDSINEAREIAITQMNSSSDAETRNNLAESVNEIINRIVNSANSQFYNKYIFAGKTASKMPYQLVSGGVAYTGSKEGFKLSVSDVLTDVLIPGNNIFGGISQPITSKDLNPALNNDTPLASLNKGYGVRLGSIKISDGVDSKVIDLSQAKTIGDVINFINNFGLSTVSASFNATNTGINITSTTGSVTVEEVNSGKTAKDLGILGSGSPTISGTDLDPIITPLTPINLLNGGVGVDTSGFVITNVTSEHTYQAAIDLTNVTTVQDLMNAVNSSGTYVIMSISSDGNKIEIHSTLSGGRLTLTENGGSTLADLGLVISFADTPLEELNNGFGIGTDLEGNEFRITRQDGVSFDIDISGLKTVNDLINAINNHPQNTGGLVVASVVAGENKIQISDNSIGSETFTITDLNSALTAQSMGLAGAHSTGTVTSSDLQPAGIEVKSVFTALLELRRGLESNNTILISRAKRMLDEVQQNVLSAQGKIGAINKTFKNMSRALENEKTGLTEILSKIEDVDIAEASAKFQMQQIALQAALLTATRVMQISLLDYI